VVVTPALVFSFSAVKAFSSSSDAGGVLFFDFFAALDIQYFFFVLDLLPPYERLSGGLVREKTVPRTEMSLIFAVLTYASNFNPVISAGYKSLCIP
jgi:hypothetical protein